MGLGSQWAAASWYSAPAKLASGWVHSKRSTCTDSSRRSRRRGVGGNSMPLAACSQSHQAAPIPTSRRPWLSWSMVAAMRARMAGWRKLLALTSTPPRMPSVWAKRAASVVHASSMGSLSGATIGTRWSMSHAER